MPFSKYIQTNHSALWYNNDNYFNLIGGTVWSFPKGHVEGTETEEETAVREIMEETGIQVALDTSFRHVITYAPKKETTKDVIYFLARALTYDYTPQEEEIAQIKWVEINHATSILSYDNDRQLVTLAKEQIKNSY